MTQVARIKSIQANGMAEVAVQRQSACAHKCSDCAGCDKMVQMADTVVIAENKLHAQKGDLVLVESESKKILTAAMIVYIFPFFLFFVFYFVGQRWSNGKEYLPILLAFLGFALGIVFAIFWDRREKKENNLRFRIVEIKEKGPGLP